VPFNISCTSGWCTGHRWKRDSH